MTPTAQWALGAAGLVLTAVQSVTGYVLQTQRAELDRLRAQSLERFRFVTEELDRRTGSAAERLDRMENRWAARLLSLDGRTLMLEEKAVDKDLVLRLAQQFDVVRGQISELQQRCVPRTAAPDRPARMMRVADL